jgi:TDG/mug DNA glycosylase family protein
MRKEQSKSRPPERKLHRETDNGGLLRSDLAGSGFPGTDCSDPHILILGSFPSRMSLECTEYYGNPKNHFWAIMESLFSIDHTLLYEDRISALSDHHIVLWDLVGSCKRTGSMDSAIEDPVFNDIPTFIDQNPGLRLIALNGTTARRYFDRLGIGETIDVVTLPSTSPAHARLTVQEKTDRWSTICRYLES